MARELKQQNILSGKIDGTKERALMRRFKISHFPSIYRINGTEMWEYSGERSARAMVAWAKGGWRNSKLRTGCEAPTSLCGRALGEGYKLPARVKETYKVLKHDKGMGDLAIFGLAISVPAALGLTVICLLDAWIRSAPLPREFHAHVD
jgi:hypothetical protein